MKANQPTANQSKKNSYFLELEKTFGNKKVPILN